MATVKLADAEATWAAVDALQAGAADTDWVLLGYAPGARAVVALLERGSGGVDELKARLPSDSVRFALFSLRVDKDEDKATTSTYGALKVIFLTWIGAETGAGLEKARAAADGPQLIALLGERHVAIGGVMQAEHPEELTVEAAAAKVLQRSAQYTVATSPRVAGGGSATAAAQTQQQQQQQKGRRTGVLEFADSCREGLAKVKDGSARWAQLVYSREKATKLELGAVGTGGAEEIAALFDENRISYAVVSVSVLAEGCTTSSFASGGGNAQLRKTVVVTMVGSHVPPLAKSRSAGHRSEVLDFVLSVLPFHFHWQPQDATEITEAELRSKVAK